VFVSASERMGKGCGSCLGEMASESREDCPVGAGNDCGKAKPSSTGSDTPRLSGIEPGIGALVCPMSHRLWRRSTGVV
jgi:hypothetical protein